jgi:hypothetical protein
MLTQSKRFPLTWRFLATELPTWRRLLPETRDPTFVHASRARGWVLKPAFGHEGDRVAIDGAMDAVEREALWSSARRRPWRWAAQRRFRALAIATPDGPRFPALGVYVVGGRACGLYGRLAATPRIDSTSRDVVILVRA